MKAMQAAQLHQMQSRSVSSLSASSTAVYRHEKIEVDNAQKLNITTPIARTDVAMGQRTYQSTIVDGLESRYGVVWYGMVWCGMVWYGMVWYGVVWCGMI